MKRVLVVDDSKDTINLIRMIFSTETDIMLDCAFTSKEAIDLFNSNSYNACVLDVSLPDITGYYLGKLIREVCSDMPIAFLTNYEGTFTKENAGYIDAQFWPKSEVFASPLELRKRIKEMTLPTACIIDTKIEIPEVIKEIS